jgi:hypothetical protein
MHARRSHLLNFLVVFRNTFAHEVNQGVLHAKMLEGMIGL